MPLLRATKPRHAKPSKAAPVLAAGGLTASFGALSVGTAEAANTEDFARLRGCESGGNYAINTGNGFYGAYQFDRRTWQGLGYSGTANQHPATVQDEAAQRLQASRGWQPWPACSRKLGLGRDEARASRGGARIRVTLARAVRPAPSLAAPAFGGLTLTTDLVKQTRPDVQQWQARMATRGWDIAADGRFGPKSAHVAARFAAEKGIKIAPGTVNQALWNAAWQLPVN